MSNTLDLPYQDIGAEWLSKKKIALLGDAMGLGKSKQVIGGLQHLGYPRTLVICPAIARLTWKNEFLKWSMIANKIHVLTKRTDIPDEAADVVICSFDYATAQEDKKKLKATKIPTHATNTLLLAWAKKFKPVMVVDESHFLKSLDARRTQAVMGRGALIHFVARAWFLTGTPMPSAPHELWPFLHVSGRTPLNYEAFVKTFCHTYEFNGNPVVTGAKREKLDELRELLAPVMLRRLKKDVLKDLPKVMVSEMLVEPDLQALPANIPPEHLEIIKVLQLTSPQEQIAALEVIAKSLPTLRRYCGLQKVFPMTELIKSELENNSYQKIVIFCIHKEVVSEIEKALKKFGVVTITGDVNATVRQKNIELFQSSPEIRVFIGNIQAAGTNITLTAANEMVFIEESYVPSDNEQGIARCARIGQTLPVNVRVARMTNSIDQKINEILLRKSGDQRILLGTDNQQKEGEL